MPIENNNNPSISKNFEEWLKQDDLYTYYRNNPSLQQSIFKDYQYEQIFKDVDSWLEWMANNQDLARKYYPDFMESFEKQIKKSPPYFTANTIQKLPDAFPIWKKRIEQLSSLTKTKKIKEQIEILELVLYKLEFDSEIIQQAIASTKDELTEQLEYWKNKLIELQTETKVGTQFSNLEWATIFYYALQSKLLPESKTVKNRWEQFMIKHDIKTTSNTFKNNYYNANKRINVTNDFPIEKLNFILPFIKENYPQVVTKIENDITFLKSEQAEY